MSRRKILIDDGNLFLSDNQNMAQVLGEFITIAYFIGTNPLPGLRRKFRMFKWCLHFPPEKDYYFNWSDVLEIVQEATLVCAFPCNGLGSSETAFITATLLDKNRKTCWDKSYWEMHGSNDYNRVSVDRHLDLKKIGFVHVKI